MEWANWRSSTPPPFCVTKGKYFQTTWVTTAGEGYLPSPVSPVSLLQSNRTDSEPSTQHVRWLVQKWETHGKGPLILRGCLFHPYLEGLKPFMFHVFFEVQGDVCYVRLPGSINLLIWLISGDWHHFSVHLNPLDRSMGPMGYFYRSIYCWILR